MNTNTVIEQFAVDRIVAILRGVPHKYLPKVVETLADNGIRAIEITLNSPDALRQIRETKILFEDRVLLGAGTVIRGEDAVRAVEAGASYLITPCVTEQVAVQARSLNVPVMMGAMTPTEIVRCMELEATWVKIFPIGSLSPGYVKDVLAPLPDARLVAVGGVTPDNLGDYLRNGAVGVGVGGSLVNVNDLSELGWERRLAERVRSYVQAIEEST